MTVDVLKKEIMFRARRGMKETDLAIARFLAVHLEEFTHQELEALRDFLKNTTDQDLMLWLFENADAPREYVHFITQIKKAQELKC